MKKIDIKKDLSFTYNHFGYMITFKGKPIGGASTDGKGRRLPSNLKFNREQAQIELDSVASGYPDNIAPHYKEAINKILSIKEV